MKAWISCLLVFFQLAVWGQSDSLTPAYQRYPQLPPFQLMLTDSSQFTREDLARKSPVLLMYFSPDCSHCIQQTEDLLKEINRFQSIEVVMASYQPLSLIRDFYAKYQLARYPNFHVGRDNQYMFPPFFQIANLPYFALYDKKRQLIWTHEGNLSAEKILRAFEK